MEQFNDGVAPEVCRVAHRRTPVVIANAGVFVEKLWILQNDLADGVHIVAPNCVNQIAGENEAWPAGRLVAAREGELRIVHELKVADFPDVRFSQKKSSLARYLPLDFPCWAKERVSRLPIAKVMVGPGENQASSKISAILLLEQMGYPNVPVEISRSTLVER